MRNFRRPAVALLGILLVVASALSASCDDLDRNEVNWTIVGKGAISCNGRPIAEKASWKYGGIQYYVPGKQLTLVASPEAGWVFEKWSGDIPSYNETITVTMDTNVNIKAEFFWGPSAPFISVPNGVGVSDAAPYLSGSGLHPVILVTSSENFARRWSDELPTEWTSTVADTQLVACLGKHEAKVLQVCPYVDAASVTRYQYFMDVKLREAKTGQVVAQTTLLGSLPGACKKQESVYTTALYGDYVTFDQLKEWLQPHVAP
jgi:hypothetical protein